MQSKATQRLMCIWIDHTRARILTMDDTGEFVERTVESDAESKHKSTGETGVRGPGHLGGGVESRYQRRRRQQLARFYDEVVAMIEPTDRVCIIGPGEAKTELRKAVEKRPPIAQTVVAVDTADKLTDAQFRERFRKVFRLESAH